MTKNKKASSESFLSAFPSALASSEKIFAIASAAAEQFDENIKASELLFIGTAVKRADEESLDEIARAFAVDWYDYNAPIEKKRRLIESLGVIYRSLGTVSCVMELITSIFGFGKIEWGQDYGGKPRHYRIAVLNPFVTEESEENFLNLTKSAVRLSAVCDGIIMPMPASCLETLAAARVRTAEKITFLRTEM